jgi:nitronate monooxygenase
MKSEEFCKKVGIKVPVICGAMYPCSNPELVAHVSKAGGLGIIQPLSMVYVHGHDYRAGIKLIRTITPNPIGLNIIVEKSIKVYEHRMREYVDIALEEGIRFFVTALGNPRWVIEKVRPHGGMVFHDVTERKWALKAMEHGVDGLICVNNRAGGHAGTKSPQELYEQMHDLGVPLICAGGIGDGSGMKEALELGYAGIQMGTRFIASKECNSHQDYKDAIVKASASEIVLTDKITGVPLAVIYSDYVKRLGLKSNWLARRLLRGPKTKHWMRLIYSLKSVWQLKKSVLKGSAYKDYYQAGKSVEGVKKVETVAEIVGNFSKVYQDFIKS